MLIVLWDTVRADHLSLYGYPRPTTPNLSRFAEDAAVFEAAVSPGMWTVPSHGSLFTGLPVAAHGADTGWIWLDHRFTTVAEHFRTHGWATWAWSTNPYLSSATNLLQGFDHVETSWSGPWAADCAAATAGKLLPDDASVEISPKWTAKGKAEGWPEHLTAYKEAGPVLHKAFAAWLDGRPADAPPFFAYLNYLEAHHPRVPSASARETVMDEATRANALTTDLSLFATMSAMEDRHTFSAADTAALNGLYDAALVDLDQTTGALLQDLAARGLLDNTIVVIVSDHGEHLGEHGLYDHRWSLREPLIHVPLVVRWPGHVSPGRRSTPVSTQSLFPTLVALTGLPLPDHVRAPSWFEPRDGPVFSELWRPNPRLPFIERAWPDVPPNRWRKRYQAVRNDQWKVVHSSDGGGAAFDLSLDPTESTDVAKQNPTVTRAGLAAIQAWQRSLPRYDARSRGLDDAPTSALAADDPLREQLDLLGYTVEEKP